MRDMRRAQMENLVEVEWGDMAQGEEQGVVPRAWHSVLTQRRCQTSSLYSQREMG